MSRVALALIYLAAAGLKVEYFYFADHPRVPGSLFQHDWMILAIVLIEVCVTVGLLTRFRALAACVAILIAIAGLFVMAHALSLPNADCRCLGRVRLSPAMHVTLSACVFFLGCRVMLDPKGGQAARASASTGPPRTAQ